ncbi:MAG TPA: 3-dehydroquinate synthase family protein, partial [Synergistales bacterium]|nr:3-dehydroquinate synthase family protein [Synergistales bacterium]
DQIRVRRAEHILPRGEEAKTQSSLWSLYSSLQVNSIDRKGTLIALGGGTVGDTAGFAAATWMRGIGHVQCPTTLLAQVDSSIGGKTGINLPSGKNLIGAFHQPLAVISDINCLQTLSEDEFRQGMGEVLKYALGEDQGLLVWLEKNLQGIRERESSVLQKMVSWCAQIKIDIVTRDEKENTGERARLNLGHTIGHALEGASCYSGWKHGDAVAFGTLLMGSLSVEKGCLDPEIYEHSSYLYRELAFQRGPLSPWEELLPFLKNDKKFHASRERFVLPVTGSHSLVVDDIPLSELRKIYEKVTA